MEEPAGRSQQWHEQELEKIRTEGDIALVRAQAERQQIAEADAQLRALQRQLKDKKRQFARLAGATGGAGVVGDAVALEQFARRQELARAQLEERLKAAVSARALELHQLRAQIDEQRRRRVDALQSEKRVLDETRHAEEAFKQSQHEAEALKERAAQLRGEIAQLQSELDDAKSSFRLERQQLQLDLDRIARPERVAVKVKVLGRKFTVFRSVAMTRKKRDALSRAKKLSLEQKVVSFEQKKVLMDRLVIESGVRTLNEFIAIYNQQEAEKAQIMARIEAKSLANGALKEVIAQLEEDITRLSGAGDIQSIVHMEQPNELKRKIDADEALIAQWTTETLAFQDALRTFRDPIRELHGELFPLDRDDECFDTTSHEVSMLRRIGAIEERVMQRVLLKILKETDASPAHASETLKRLQRYRGALKRKESSLATTVAPTTPTTTTLVESSSPARMSVAPLVVDVPSLRDSLAGKGADEDEEDADDYGDEPVAAVRSEDCRPKRPSTPSQATSSSANSTR